MPPETEAANRRPAFSVAALKELFGLFRELFFAICIPLFFLLLLCWPETVRDRLHRAGIKQIAGVEIDTSQVEKAVRETGDAQQHVAEIKQSVEATKQELDTLRTQANNPEVQKKI